jgi:hypothetical protein
MFTPWPEEAPKDGPLGKWEPTFVDEKLYQLSRAMLSQSNEELAKLKPTDDDIEKLVDSGMLLRNADDPRLLTTSGDFKAVRLPDGRFVIADDSSGRLSRWLAKTFGASLS